MAKKQKNYYASMKEALETFDLKIYLKWLKVYNPVLFVCFIDEPKEVQMATMCKTICGRTDMLNTEAHKKALKWLSEHNMKGRLF